jgi:putative phosphoesterase
MVGVIADTHRLLRREAIDFLKRVDFIVHAGDVGGPDILMALRSIAPTCAVRGNVDRDAWAQEIPDKEVLEVAGKFLYVIHKKGQKRRAGK